MATGQDPSWFFEEVVVPLSHFATAPPLPSSPRDAGIDLALGRRVLDRLLALQTGRCVWFWKLLSPRERVLKAVWLGLQDMAAELGECDIELSVPPALDDGMKPSEELGGLTFLRESRWSATNEHDDTAHTPNLRLRQEQVDYLDALVDAYRHASPPRLLGREDVMREAIRRSVAACELDERRVDEPGGPIVPQIATLHLPPEIVRKYFALCTRPTVIVRRMPQQRPPRAARRQRSARVRCAPSSGVAPDDPPPHEPPPEPPARAESARESPPPDALPVRAARAIAGWITTAEFAEALGKPDSRAGRDWCKRHNVPYRRDGKFNWLRIEDVERAISKLPETGRAEAAADSRELAAAVATMQVRRKKRS